MEDARRALDLMAAHVKKGQLAEVRLPHVAACARGVRLHRADVDDLLQRIASPYLPHYWPTEITTWGEGDDNVYSISTQAAALGNKLAAPLGVAAADMELGAQLHNGRQGSIHAGRWRGRDVAVKRARIGTSADMERFRSELCVMAGVSGHPHVVPLLAARALPPGYMLVLPRLPSSLADRLHREGWKPSRSQTMRIALELAEGIAHIHSQGVLHRDINPANIMLDKSGSVAIGDFGIAALESALAAEHSDRQSLVGRENPSGGFQKRHMLGTLEYMAPEVLLRQPYGFPADVYAWAVTVNEACTSTVPFSDCTKDNPAAHTVLNFGYGRQELAAAIVSEGLRPHVAADIPPALGSIIEACWALDPASRPSAAELVRALSDMAAAIRDDAAEQSHVIARSERERQAARKKAALSHRDSCAVDTDSDSAMTSATAPRMSPAHSSWETKPSAQIGGEAAGSTSYASTAQRPPAADEAQLLREKGALQLTGVHMQAGAFATAGDRGEDRMEDRHVIANPLDGLEPAVSVAAVFDGHRGAAAAEFAAARLAQALPEAWPGGGRGAALQACFECIDREYCALEARQHEERVARLGASAGPPRHAGCTAVVAVISQGDLWIANAGDCRAVLCRASAAVQLTDDHTAARPDERLRIEAAGGAVRRVASSWRIGEAGIQVTRSIGDADLKCAGLSAVPEVAHVRLRAEDAFLVLASDGLWDCVPPADAVALVHDTVKDAATCARRLATEALTRGSRDNITVIVAFLQPVETIERIYADGVQKYRVAPTIHGGRN